MQLNLTTLFRSITRSLPSHCCAGRNRRCSQAGLSTVLYKLGDAGLIFLITTPNLLRILPSPALVTLQDRLSCTSFTVSSQSMLPLHSTLHFETLLNL